MRSSFGGLFLAFTILHNNVFSHQCEEPQLEMVTAIGEDWVEQATTIPTEQKLVTNNANAEDRARLRRDLFRNHDPKIHPDNLIVEFGIALNHIDIVEEKSTVESGLRKKVVWTDSRLSWDEADYGGLELLRLDQDDIWKPDITLYNSANQPRMVECWKSYVLVYPNGNILWVPPCHVSSKCVMQFKVFPYGEQNCTLKFGSWTHHGFVMGLKFYLDQEKMDMEDFEESPKWEIASNTAIRTEKYYDCCVEPYLYLKYSFTFKRRPDIPYLATSVQ